MTFGHSHWKLAAAAIAAIALLGVPQAAAAGQAGGDDVTFTKDIAPILQRSCQSCHRPSSVAPMSLLTYEEVRPWARSIKQRTALRNRMGVMPPWFIEKDVGIQSFKEDISLSEVEIEMIGAWVDAGAPRGNPADMPPPVVFTAANEWDIGEPDIVVESAPFTMEAEAPDYWGALPPTPVGNTEDRYVAAVQIKEVSDVQGGTGGKFIFHHAIHALLGPDGSPVGAVGGPHEVGRNGETFDAQAGILLPAGAELVWPSIHMHANGERTTARLITAYRFHPRGYEPTRRFGNVQLANGELDLDPMTPGQELEMYATLRENIKLTSFEPHMHASGVRMCLEAIWGGRTETLNCAGYDHNWVKVYHYEDDYAPLLPKGTLLKVTSYFDTTAANKNVIDPRNWQGLGHRSIDNMAIMLSIPLALTDEEFAEEMQARRERLGLAKGESMIGCPLCGFEELPAAMRAQN